jgi:hypothetical protein
MLNVKGGEDVMAAAWYITDRNTKDWRTSSDTSLARENDATQKWRKEQAGKCPGGLEFLKE